MWPEGRLRENERKALNNSQTIKLAVYIHKAK